MRYVLGFMCVLALGLMACGETSGMGGAGGAGAGGAGGRVQIPSDQAQTPEECEFLGVGGSDAIYCDYVTVEFSTALPTTGLDVEVTTSLGDTLTPVVDEEPDQPALTLTLDEAEAQATGFTITRIAKQPHYSPAEFSVVVTMDATVVADATLEPSYTCVELTSDDWCWQGAPQTLDVKP